MTNLQKVQRAEEYISHHTGDKYQNAGCRWPSLTNLWNHPEKKGKGKETENSHVDFWVDPSIQILTKTHTPHANVSLPQGNPDFSFM